MDNNSQALTKSLALQEFVINNIRARNFVVTGDTSHMSVAFYINEFNKIDKKPEYDFQNYEEDALRVIRQFMLNTWLYTDWRKVDIQSIMDGKTSHTIESDISSYSCRCADCAEPISFTICGNKLHFEAPTGPCKSNRHFSVDIDIPTGEIVMADWPPDFDNFREEMDKRPPGQVYDSKLDINYFYGIRHHTEKHASHNVLHMFVGNTCPGVIYNKKTNKLAVGSTIEYDNETDEEINKIPKGYKKVGSICTDLWWTTIMDKSVYEKLRNKNGKGRGYGRVNEAVIRPGRYRFSWYYVNDSYFEKDKDHPWYITAERIGDVP